MATEINLNKMVAFTDIIICGYIRPMEKVISFGNLNIIPLAIFQMCLKYYAFHISGQIFARISQDNHQKFVYIDIHKKKVINVKTITNIETEEEDENEYRWYWSSFDKDLCDISESKLDNDRDKSEGGVFANNLKLSPKAIEHFKKHDDKLKFPENDQYSAFITSSNIHFFENNSISITNNGDETIKVYSYPLPKLTKKRKRCGMLLYSNHYGLIKHGLGMYRDKNNIDTRLRFNDELGLSFMIKSPSKFIHT